MNNTGHILDNNIDTSHMINKDHDIIHEDDLDEDFKKDLGLEYESTSQATSTPKESNSPPKLKSNLEEVIESVIQDAIDYADAPQEKRILPALTRKSTKAKVKAVSVNSSSSISTFTNVASPQQQLNPMNNSGLLMPANNSNPNSFHPLVQANLPPGMQHMLQLASNGKPGISMGASNTSTSLQLSNNTTQQQQMASAMMGFSAAQLPNMIMPSYSTNLQSNYSQQASSGQYQLPVSLSQIQLAQQQQSPHLLLGNNPNSFTDLSTSGGNQQNINFGNGISNANQQLLQSSYGNFGGNSGISVSPYQIPNMIQGYTQPTVSDNGNSNPISQNDSINSAVNLNSNPTSASCFHSSKTSNNNALTLNSVSTNQNISTTSSAAAAAAAAATLYQNPFDLQPTQIYAHHRLLQAQQMQQNSTPGIFPDYAAVMARYGAYH